MDFLSFNIIVNVVIKQKISFLLTYIKYNKILIPGMRMKTRITATAIYSNLEKTRHFS